MMIIIIVGGANDKDFLHIIPTANQRETHHIDTFTRKDGGHPPRKNIEADDFVGFRVK